MERLVPASTHNIFQRLALLPQLNDADVIVNGLGVVNRSIIDASIGLHY